MAIVSKFEVSRREKAGGSTGRCFLKKNGNATAAPNTTMWKAASKPICFGLMQHAHTEQRHTLTHANTNLDRDPVSSTICMLLHAFARVCLIFVWMLLLTCQALAPRSPADVPARHWNYEKLSNPNSNNQDMSKRYEKGCE